ncbi:hypothetical protein EJ04DRAFT_521965 [Polyplosphaeria fusca]|uniref:Uncharacterized protein n=1 Tax=Polyplosphaeria fusca TaxID=682080 RepID=A0A9P4R434_9PLEO|nr:hypothetical protein EJ04DRAFT_521965 [Polyplosphaeria fusca]
MKHAERDSTEYQDSSTDHLLPDHEHGIFPISRDTSARDQRWWRRISITNLIILSINSILLIYLVKQAAVLPHSSNPSSQTPSAIRKHELGLTSPVPAAEAIEYEDVTFSDSGFDARHNIPNIFEGPRTPAQDEAWMKLTTGPPANSILQSKR